MTNAVVVSLREPGEIDPRVVLTGPLKKIRRVRLAAAENICLAATGVEFTLFVLAGSGTAATASAKVPLRYGVSVTVPLDTEVQVTAGDESLEYFLAELEVGRNGTR